MTSFLSDSDDDSAVVLPPLHQEIFEELCSSEEVAEIPVTPGFVGNPVSISTDQPLFTVIDYFFRQIDSYYTEIFVRLWPGLGHSERYVHLRGQWINSSISIADPCFIVGKWELGNDPAGNVYENKYYTIIDDTNGFFISLPHVLISGTEMATAQRCRRQTYINSLCPEGLSNMDMFRGSICHILLQKVFFGLKDEEIDHALDQLLESSKYELFLMNETKESAKTNIVPYLGTVRMIANAIQNNSNQFNLDHKLFNSIATPIEALPPYGAKTVQEEENIWSFQWGLKGKIDATMEKDGIMFPFELKTGSTYNGQVKDDNVLQLSSYIFMMKERYQTQSAPCGLLFYLKDKSSFIIKPRRIELLSIVMSRNLIAHSLAHGAVPPTASTPRTCKYCPGKKICAFLEYENDTAVKSELIGQLSYSPGVRHKDFYNEWDRRLVSELMNSLDVQTQIWTVPIGKRVAYGRAITNLQTGNGKSPIVNFNYTGQGGSIEKTQISPSNMVLITKNGLPPVLGRGNVTAIENNVVTIEIIESTLNEVEEDICIDLWESYSTVTRCRRNLMTMLTEGTTCCDNLRNYVIENKAPTFLPLKNEIPVEDNDLNEDQAHAIRMALAANDYMLLLGMPGTGKTTTLALLVESLEKCDKSVLICSYTHAAVDNLCSKLIDRGVNFLRIGRIDSISEKVRSHALDSIIETCENAEQLHLALTGIKIFACTCYAFNHPFILGKNFDYCVIDEASQISMPVVIGPLTKCNKFILVGDHYQLPPISKNDGEIPISLFKMLSENQPHAIVTMRTQYRMNSDIMKLCNELVYSNRMRSGSAASAQSRIYFPNISILKEFSEYSREWISKILSPEPAVQFIDTDSVLMREGKNMSSKNNIGEGSVVSMIVSSMILCGISPESIGVITPYRAQVVFIRKALQAQLASVSKFFPHMSGLTAENANEVEVDTVDKYQGRDKECIIISTVKSNEKFSPGAHTSDWQRMNVAITRAKTKLIFIGSMSTLSNSPFFEHMFEMLEEKNIYKLPLSVNEGESKPFRSIDASIVFGKDEK